MSTEVIISGNDDSELGEKLFIHPNPTSNFITIVNNTGFKTTKVTFINNVGLEAKVITKSHIEIISIAELPSGNYILEIIAGNHKIYKKLSVFKN